MKWIQQTVLAVGLLCLAPGLVHALSEFSDGQEIRCSYSQVTASFTAERAKYSISGSCISTVPPVSVPWSAEGVYDARTVNGQFGHVKEKIVVSGPSPYRGEFQLAMVCNSYLGKAMPFDPWLQNVDATKGVCTQMQIQVTGEIAEGYRYRKDSGLTQQYDIDLKKHLLNQAQARRGPVTASFPYDRPPLLAKRQTDLQAEVAKAEKAKRRGEQIGQAATQPPSTYRAAQSPIVRSPVAGQRFFKQAAVPIKLDPPGGLTIGGYMVRIERKASAGNWLAQTTLPVGAVQAASAAGYTGFGAGTPPCCLTEPGAYRLSAQVSYPKPSGWSDWVEFVVIEPPASNFNQLKPRTRTFPR